MASKKGDAAGEISRSILAMLLREPFFAHLLGGIPRRICEDVPTAAVALTPRGAELIVNPGFFVNDLSTQERVAVIKHEALHLVFRHLYRPLMKQGDPRLFNIAADIVVNQHVKPWPLPDTAITLSTFPDLELESDKHLEWYYEKLIKLQRELQSRKPEETSAPRSAEVLKGNAVNQTHSDHRYWSAQGGYGFANEGGNRDSEDPRLSETLRRALESDLERHLIRAKDRTSTTQWGALPAGIRTQISEVEASRTVKTDWRRHLRLFASCGSRTRVLPTNRKMSKRFGTFPGIKIKREKRVAIVVDTSGSIDTEILSKFFAEIHGVWRTGAEVVVIECDAQVHQVYPYKGKVPNTCEGGGGTEFDPAFKWLRSPKTGKFDACIYLTDGFGPEPVVRPPCPVLWCLTDERGNGEHLKWGRSILIEKSEGA